MKKHLCIAAVIILVLCSNLTAFAAVKTMPDGTQFDAAFYAATYPDVVAVFGTDEKLLYQHYLQYGKAEGRIPHAPAAAAPAVPAAGGRIDNITEIGHSLWIPDAYVSEPLSQTDRQQHYVRYYTAGGTAIAVQYINLKVPDYQTLHALLIQAGIKDIRVMDINGTPMYAYEIPEQGTGSFDTLYNGGIVEITFYPTNNPAMADIAAAVMASYH